MSGLSSIPPFKMHGNVYFVGSAAVSVHMIDTEEGLVLIDTGYPNMYEQILDSIETLGFDPKSITAIFHTHGHIDHYGCTRELKALTGATTYISKIDNDIVNGTYDLSWAKEADLDRIPPFDCDVLLEDGDVFTFGSTTVRCVHTPGHTAGVMSFFITARDEKGNAFVAAMHGGIGTNSMRAEFLRGYGLSLDCRDRFREGIHRLASERVDLVLGNHPEQNETKAKREAVLSGASILDAGEWQRFLVSAEEILDWLLKSELTSI